MAGCTLGEMTLLGGHHSGVDVAVVVEAVDPAASLAQAQALAEEAGSRMMPLAVSRQEGGAMSVWMALTRKTGSTLGSQCSCMHIGL